MRGPAGQTGISFRSGIRERGHNGIFVSQVRNYLMKQSPFFQFVILFLQIYGNLFKESIRKKQYIKIQIRL